MPIPRGGLKQKKKGKINSQKRKKDSTEKIKT